MPYVALPWMGAGKENTNKEKSMHQNNGTIDVILGYAPLGLVRATTRDIHLDGPYPWLEMPRSKSI